MDDLIGVVILLVFGVIAAIIKSLQTRNEKRGRIQQRLPRQTDQSRKTLQSQQETQALTFSLEQLYEKALSMQRREEPHTFPVEPTQSVEAGTFPSIEATSPAISLEELFTRTIAPSPLPQEEPVEENHRKPAKEPVLWDKPDPLRGEKGKPSLSPLFVRMKSLNPLQQALLYHELLDPPLSLRKRRLSFEE